MPDSETRGWGPPLAAESLPGLRAPGSSRLNFSKTKGELGGPEVLEGYCGDGFAFGWRFKPPCGCQKQGIRGWRSWSVQSDTFRSPWVLTELFVFLGFTDLNSRIPLECYAVFKP